MIDWWLLIALNTLVASMAFHTYLIYIIKQTNKESFRFVQSFTNGNEINKMSKRGSLREIHSGGADFPGKIF